MYKTNKSFNLDKGFNVTYENVLQAVKETNDLLKELPEIVFPYIDFKTTSAIIGGFFCAKLAGNCDGAMVNPIEKGHPDIIPIEAANASEAELRNYPSGLEIKCTVGNINKGANLRATQTRIHNLKNIVWQAHHRDVTELMGIVWDFHCSEGGFNYPIITAIFYADNLIEGDWGAISGTTGRNTKVSGMKASGKIKMGAGWVVLFDDPVFQDTYKKILKFNPTD